MIVSFPRSDVGWSVIVAGPGLRLNDDSDLIHVLSSVCQCLMFAFGWAHSGSISGFL